MARSLTDVFQINGKPMFAPDASVGMSYEDLDAADSGRDESGVMHRIVVRYKLGTWSFEYACITQEEKEYMESLFPDAQDFLFTHPDRKDASAPVTSRCYRSKYSASWYNSVSGLWKNYKFNIIEC